jgi:hypothetical protein
VFSEEIARKLNFSIPCGISGNNNQAGITDFSFMMCWKIFELKRKRKNLYNIMSNKIFMKHFC